MQPQTETNFQSIEELTSEFNEEDTSELTNEWQIRILLAIAQQLSVIAEELNIIAGK